MKPERVVVNEGKENEYTALILPDTGDEVRWYGCGIVTVVENKVERQLYLMGENDEK